MFRLKIKQTEKAVNKRNKIIIISPLILTKKDFIFIFNMNIKKINRMKKGTLNITILTFYKNIYNNNNIYKINI